MHGTLARLKLTQKKDAACRRTRGNAERPLLGPSGRRGCACGLEGEAAQPEPGQAVLPGRDLGQNQPACPGDLERLINPGSPTLLVQAASFESSYNRRHVAAPDIQAKTGRAGHRGPDDELAAHLELARQAETQAHELARDIRTLTQSGQSRSRPGAHPSPDAAAVRGPAITAPPRPATSQ